MISTGLNSSFSTSLALTINQDKIGPEKVVVHVQLYSDATQLNRVGTKKCWGVWMYIGNIPQELRVSRKKKGAVILLGYIPEVCATLFCYASDITGVFRSPDTVDSDRDVPAAEFT